MTAYLKSIDKGYPGARSRVQGFGDVVKTEIAGPGSQFVFGQPLLLKNGLVNLYDHAIGAGESFVGFSVRPFPKQGKATMLGEADLSYEGEAVSVLQSGFMTVILKGATNAVRNTPVRVVTVAGADAAVGDLVATTTGTAVVIPTAYFNGDATPGSIVEIVYNVLP